MSRDLVKTAAKAGAPTDDRIIPNAYQLSIEDLARLFELSHEGKIMEVIDLAFRFGFVMGNRATVSRKLKRL